MLNPYRHASIFGVIIVAVVVFALEQSRATDFALDYGAIPGADRSGVPTDSRWQF